MKSAIKKILFPFEINRTCYREAYVYAAKLTRNLGAELILLHAFEIEVDNSITPKGYDQLIRNNWIKAYREIVLFHDYYLSDFARADGELRIKADHRIINGDLQSEYRSILRTEKIDLVVLPAVGDTPSTSKNLRLMRREALDTELTSLLTTPFDKKYIQFDRILFLLGSKRMKGLTDYFDDILLFANIFNSSIHFVQLSKHEKHTSNMEEEFANTISEDQSLSNRLIFDTITDRDLAGKLLVYIQENDIRMVAVAKQQLHVVRELIFDHIHEEVSARFKMPLLILKDGNPVKD